jgi:hypothetical protein
MRPVACAPTAKLTDATSKRHNSANLFDFIISFTYFLVYKRILAETTLRGYLKCISSNNNLGTFSYLQVFIALAIIVNIKKHSVRLNHFSKYLPVIASLVEG